jgi:hypothetical protein
MQDNSSVLAEAWDQLNQARLAGRNIPGMEESLRRVEARLRDEGKVILEHATPSFPPHTHFELEKAIPDVLGGLGTGQGTHMRGPGVLYGAEEPKVIDTYMQEFGSWYPKVSSFGSPKASRYRLGIDAKKESFMDWEKTLGEHPKEVQERLLKGLGEPPYAEWKTPADILTALAQQGKVLFPNNPAMVKRWSVQQLAEAGIPGVKYYDAGSRAGAEGTRNYVIYDPKLIKILKIMGITGAGIIFAGEQPSAEAKEKAKP